MKGKESQKTEEKECKDKPPQDKKTGDSPASSKGSSPDMDEYEVITKGKSILWALYINLMPTPEYQSCLSIHNKFSHGHDLLS